MGGLGQQVSTVVQPLAFGFDAEVQPFPYDPKKAKRAPGPGRLPERRGHQRATAPSWSSARCSRPSRRC